MQPQSQRAPQQPQGMAPSAPISIVKLVFFLRYGEVEERPGSTTWHGYAQISKSLKLQVAEVKAILIL